MSAQKIYRFSKINPILLLVGFVMVMAMLFWIAQSIFRLLSFISPVFLVVAVVVNYRVVTGYARWLLESVKRNTPFGVIAIIFTVLGFPIVSLYLLIKALASRGLTNVVNSEKGEFINYEEVNDDFLDLSEVKEHKKKIDNDYNDVF